MQEYRFSYRVEPLDLMVLSLVGIYQSMAGLINIIFAVSMALVTVRFWSDASWVFRSLMLLGVLLFPVLQPMAIYLRSRAIASRLPTDLQIVFDDEGMTVESPNASTTLAYSDLAAVTMIAGMIIIRTRGKQGYALGRAVLGGRSRELYDLLSRRIDAD